MAATPDSTAPLGLGMTAELPAGRAFRVQAYSSVSGKLQALSASVTGTETCTVSPGLASAPAAAAWGVGEAGPPGGAEMIKMPDVTMPSTGG